ncbi:small acidic protein family domain-containing protein [Phthorimaea operculella]|nr:small acidic protein family domain-containing protein [Phthorimaea operculella]
MDSLVGYGSDDDNETERYGGHHYSGSGGGGGGSRRRDDDTNYDDVNMDMSESNTPILRRGLQDSATAARPTAPLYAQSDCSLANYTPNAQIGASRLPEAVRCLTRHTLVRRRAKFGPIWMPNKLIGKFLRRIDFGSARARSPEHEHALPRDSQAESEPELPQAEPQPSRHYDDRRGSDDSRNRDRERERDYNRRESPSRRPDRADRRSPRNDKHSRSDRDRGDRGRGYEGGSRRGLLGDRPDDKPPALMDLKPFGGDAPPPPHPAPGYGRDRSSQDARDAVSPSDRGDRGDRGDYSDRDRSRERSREKSHGRSEERYGRGPPRGAAYPPPSTASSSSGSERRGSPPSGDYRPSYKVNKKLEVMEKMGLQIKTPDGSMATAQQLRTAASTAPPQQSSGLPSYFNNAAISSSKILDQLQQDIRSSMYLYINTPDGSMATAQQLRTAASTAPPQQSSGLPSYFNNAAISSSKILDQVYLYINTPDGSIATAQQLRTAASTAPPQQSSGLPSYFNNAAISCSKILDQVYLYINTPDGSMATAQQLRTAASTAPPQQSSGLPSYFNNAAISCSKILDQVYLYINTLDGSMATAQQLRTAASTAPPQQSSGLPSYFNNAAISSSKILDQLQQDTRPGMYLYIKTPDGSMATAQQLRTAASTAPPQQSSGLPSYFNNAAISSSKILDQLQQDTRPGMYLYIKTPDGSMATAQQLRTAASTAPPQQSSGLPSYFNNAAISSSKILDQVQKRKMLWSNKSKDEAAEAAKWSGTRFAQDNDGKQVSKFMRLMGIKEPAAVKPEPASKEADPIKKQEELFQAMQAQYEVARATTHTMRGVGLGFQRGQF